MNEDFLNVIESRRSIRKFHPDEIPDKHIQRLIESGISAPSAGNRQPWRIVVTKDSKIKEKLKRGAFGQRFISEAPVVISVCMVPEESAERYGDRGRTLYAFQDTAALTQNILLAAHTMGYGSCWVGAFDDAMVAEALNVPEGIRPIAIIPIGKIAGEYPQLRPRRPISEIVVQNSF